MEWRKTKKEQAASSDSGVLFWWHHEGRNNHIHNIIWPPKWFKKNKSPNTKTVLHWLLSYCVFHRYFSADCGTDCTCLLVILLHHREYWGMETTWNIGQTEVMENKPFYCSWITWRSTTAHTLYSACCLDTSERVAWIKIYCLSLITCCQNSKSDQSHLTAGSNLIV